MIDHLDTPATDPHTGAVPGQPEPAVPLTMRDAETGDLEFICEQIFHAAGKGHFDRRLVEPKHQETTRRDIESIIRLRRRSGKPLSAHASVFTHHDQRIGFVVLTELAEMPGLELYAFAVDGRFRGKGYGSCMLTQVLDRFLAPAKTLFVRCFPPSVVMYEMLVDRGFDLVYTTRNGARVLRRDFNPTPRGQDEIQFLTRRRGGAENTEIKKTSSD